MKQPVTFCMWFPLHTWSLSQQMTLATSAKGRYSSENGEWSTLFHWMVYLCSFTLGRNMIDSVKFPLSHIFKNTPNHLVLWFQLFLEPANPCIPLPSQTNLWHPSPVFVKRRDVASSGKHVDASFVNLRKELFKNYALKVWWLPQFPWNLKVDLSPPVLVYWRYQFNKG